MKAEWSAEGNCWPCLARASVVLDHLPKAATIRGYLQVQDYTCSQFLHGTPLIMASIQRRILHRNSRALNLSDFYLFTVYSGLFRLLSIMKCIIQ